MVNKSQGLSADMNPHRNGCGLHKIWPWETCAHHYPFLTIFDVTQGGAALSITTLIPFLSTCSCPQTTPTTTNVTTTRMRNNGEGKEDTTRGGPAPSPHVFKANREGGHLLHLFWHDRGSWPSLNRAKKSGCKGAPVVSFSFVHIHWCWSACYRSRSVYRYI